jgi:NADH-quinone oxidoreductase subunit G
MLATPRKAYLLVGVEPDLDTYNPRRAVRAMNEADIVVAAATYIGRLPEHADVLLPIAPFTETSGSFVNTDGRMQSFNPVVHPLGESRPGWKVLRVLANLLGLPGFDYDRSEQVRDEACKADAVANRLSNALDGVAIELPRTDKAAVERVADVPIYFADPIVRRAASLQATSDANPPRAFANGTLLRRLGLSAGEQVRLRQNGSAMAIELARDDGLPDNAVRLATAHPSTSGMGGMFDEIVVERT